MALVARPRTVKPTSHLRLCCTTLLCDYVATCDCAVHHHHRWDSGLTAVEAGTCCLTVSSRNRLLYTIQLNACVVHVTPSACTISNRHSSPSIRITGAAPHDNSRISLLVKTTNDKRKCWKEKKRKKLVKLIYYFRLFCYRICSFWWNKDFQNTKNTNHTLKLTITKNEISLGQ